MTQSTSFDIVVIGAGIAGISAAAELAPMARVLLLETETQPGYHATGRSAAILAQTYGNDIVRDLTRASDAFLNTPPEDFADAPLLTPRGLVRIARQDQVDQLRAMYEELQGTGYLRWIDGPEIEARLPHIRPGYAVGGFANDNAMDIDVHAMVQGYLRQFRQAGGVFVARSEVTALTRCTDHWVIQAADKTYEAATVINAAGAWADQIAELAGGQGLGLQPLRRSALTFRAPDHLNVGDLPMVVDANEDFYLKPEAGKLLASPANETLSDPCDSRPEEMEVAIAVDRVLSAFDLDVRRIESQWAGLRTFAPDRAPVCGFDDDMDGFFWLAGQGGFGIQTAPALSRLTAHLCGGAGMDPALTVTGLDPASLAPGRFHTGKTDTAA